MKPKVFYIRSIMITGHADKEAIERVKKEAGTYAVLPKPWNANELIKAVQNCCE